MNVKLWLHSDMYSWAPFLDPEDINSLNTELNPTCHLLALLGAHHILHVSRIRVKSSSLGAICYINK
jgi:hypothetical protein